jgi:membrane-bound serine protease (ClpP class)
VHTGKVTTGSQGLVGEIGTALKDFEAMGKVLIHGEIWNAQSDDIIRKDDRVIVTGVNSMVLLVEKKNN